MSNSRLTLVAAVLAAAFPALAADMVKDKDKDNSKEVATAAAHAGMAAGAESPQMVKSHLQHVINCLEGGKGADFAAALGNPCASFGDGAIPDAKEDGKRRLEDAAGMARQAMAELNVAKARQIAAEIQSELSK